MRVCVNTGNRLHLIRPYGFAWDDAKLRRAGLDYQHHAPVAHHDTIDDFLAVVAPPRVFVYSQRAEKLYTDIEYLPGDALVFGSESVGLPVEVMTGSFVTDQLRIPVTPAGRSLNLANAAAVVVYEAWRQLGFAGSDRFRGAEPI